MTAPACRTCYDRKPFDEYGMHYNYCGQLGRDDNNRPILYVDQWLHTKSRPVFCPVTFPEVVEGWRGAEANRKDK